jgi:beta-N-acetylhexosaminidase
MLAFRGFELPASLAERLSRAPAAGVTLLRWLNVRTAGQLRELTDALQRAAAASRPVPGPLLVAADQEGGQAIALGDFSTAFPGNMALGATGDPELARRVGRAMGLEALAVGSNVLYAPVCDLASNPANPGLGIRSFGADPVAVGSFAAAFVRGVRESGAAATAKHFPGLGEVGVDTHHALAAVDRSRAELAGAELPPFRAAIEAGAELVMSAHVGVPGVTGDPDLPATLSREVMDGLLRGDLGFGGVTITDALDMRALAQGEAMAIDALAAVAAGEDLLLLMPDEELSDRVEAALVHSARRRLFDRAAMSASLARVARLRARLGTVDRPALDVVGCAEHLELAREVAERSITLVRDEVGCLPLRLAPERAVLAVMPAPADLTPADTSSGVRPGLAAALRRRHPRVEEIVTAQAPTAAEIAAVRERAAAADLVVVGTLAATFRPEQVELVAAILDTGVPTVTVALRTPWELGAYPEALVHVATYGILPASLEALADALFGVIPFRGRLPTPIPGVAALGYAAAVA